MRKRKIKITSVGKYLPNYIITSEKIDQLLQVPEGWTAKKSGVRKRHYAAEETASEMGAKAVHAALEKANMDIDEMDCIVCASGTMEQPIPCTAALIHEKLSPEVPIPAFDINSTCLSFVTALDVISHLIDKGSYQKVIIVSSEISSVGLNKQQKESYVLFGDGAAACIIERANEGERSAIRSSQMETYSEGAHLTEIRGGGTKHHPNQHSVKEDYLFDMAGRKVYKMSAKVINLFVEKLLAKAQVSLDGLAAVVPHQASGMALRLMRKKLNIPSSRFINVIENYGNTIAASIPLALCDAIENGRIRRGDTIMLLGTSAGLSVGGVILDY